MQGISPRVRGLIVLFAAIVFSTIESSAVPPRIVGFSPHVRYVREHQPYWFSVAAIGTHRLVYHWWHQEPDSIVGHEIPNEFGLIILRPRLTVYNALNNRDYNGWYWCVVEDAVTGETVTSPRGQLVVVTPPNITQQPADLTIPVGATATFSTSADAGAPIPIRYHWYFGGRPILGATSRTLTIWNVQRWRAGYYTCRVTTLGGSSFTSGAQLVVGQ